MKSTAGIPKIGAYVPQGAPPEEPPYLKNIDTQVQAEASPYLQNNQQTAGAANIPANAVAQQSPDEITASLKALDRTNSLLTMANQNNPNVDHSKDYDAEIHGFGNTDKLSMLGALVMSSAMPTMYAALQTIPSEDIPGAKTTGAVAAGAGVGAAEFAARAIQLLTKMSRTGSYTDQLGKDFTDWFNRTESRSDLIQEAIANAPAAYEVGKIGGSLAATLGGGELLGSAIKAADIGEGLSGAMSAIKYGTTNGAAKAIANSQYTATALKLAQVAGTGAAIGETQYDPENNHFLNQAITGAIWGLTLHAGGSLIKNLAEPTANAIQALAQKYNIQLPVKASWERIAQYLPGSGYGKLIQQRAAQVAQIAEDIKTPIVEAGKKSIAEDLEDEKREIAFKLMAPEQEMDSYTRDKLMSRWNALKWQQNNLGNINGYNAYLADSLAKSRDIAKEQYGIMLNQVKQKLGSDTYVETPITKNIAQKINNEESDVLNGLRQTRIAKITDDLMKDQGFSNEMQKAGIQTPQDATRYVTNLINKSYMPSTGEGLNGYVAAIQKKLQEEGLIASPVDIKDPIQQLSLDNRFTFDSFKLNMSRVRDKAQSTTNDMEARNLWRVYDGMWQDMRNHVEQYGGQDTLDLFNQAQKLYQDRVAPFSKAPFRDYRSAGQNADDFIGQFFKPDGKQSAEELMKMMPQGDQRAQMAVKAAIMNEAWNRAYIPHVGINPMQFIHEINKLGTVNDVIFSPKEQEAFDGYEQLVNTVHNISKEALEAGRGEGKQLSSGSLTTDVLKQKHLLGVVGAGAGLFGGAFFGHGMLTLPVILFGGAFGKLMTTSLGRSLMVQAAKLGNKASEAEVNPILQQIHKLLLYGGSQAVAPLGRSM